MQRTSILLLLILLTMPAWAQVAIPGTFRTAPVQTTPDIYTPVLTPPEVSFGSGLSGPVVINRQPVLVAVPQGAPAEPSMAAAAAEPELSVAQAAANSRAITAQLHNDKAPFDFIVAPNADSLGSNSGESLGEIAASLRKGPPPTQRNFNNDDISRMNSSSGGNYAMPAGKAPQTQPQTEPKPPQPQQNQIDQKRQRTPFTPQMTAEE
ncbi:MAG TPA: hypothetical protein VF135_07115 [Terriglobales bacterium]